VTEEVIPRCQALGVTYQHPEDDRYNYPEEYLRARMSALWAVAAQKR
jgi:cell division protease FtsH